MLCWGIDGSMSKNLQTPFSKCLEKYVGFDIGFDVDFHPILTNLGVGNLPKINKKK